MAWKTISAPDGYAAVNPLDPVAAQVLPMIVDTDFWREVGNRPIAETRAMSLAGQEVERSETLTIPVGDGASIDGRLYAPANPRATVIWFHGGGFVLGSVAEIDNFLRRMANEAQVAVISVDYRMAPEHPFPTAAEDSVATVRWVDEHRADLKLTGLPLYVGGDSAGGNLATVSALILRDTGVQLSGQILAYPCTDNCDAPSIERFDPPFLDKAELRFLLDQYAVSEADQQDWRFAPMRAETLAGMPPAVILTAEHDSLAQQGEEYGMRMRSEGVDVDIRRYTGQIHGFITMDVFAEGAGGEAMAAIAGFIDHTAK